ncbi:hypothetical protein AB0G00_00065 [Nocardia salmonicida]|uniref:hypothetical protein n=1 Tax=Nocardia salmonicida TaxID=53431 RepID=UPI0033E5E878
MNEQTIYPGSRATQILAVVSAPLVGVIGVMFMMLEEFAVLERIVMGGGVLVASIMGTFLAVMALVRNRPELVIDTEGLLVPPARKIHWHEVAAVRLRKSGPSNAVEIILHERSGRETRRSPLQRALHSGWSTVGDRKAMTLSPTRLHPYSPEAVVVEMLHYHPRLHVAAPETS